MDLATIIGVLAGAGMLFWAITFGGHSLTAFLDLHGALIVFGGTMSALLIMFPLATVLRSFSVAMKAFILKLDHPQQVLNKLVGLATRARRESVLALESEKFDYPFMGRAIRLVVDGVEQKSIRQILEIEIGSLKERHSVGQQVFEQMGVMGPSFGMIGTLIGLVQMLRNLSEPSTIGPSMSVAMVATFYGAVLANMIGIPLSKKLERRSREEIYNMEIIVEGVLAISQKENPNVIKEKLNSFMSPKHKIG